MQQVVPLNKIKLGIRYDSLQFQMFSKKQSIESYNIKQKFPLSRMKYTRHKESNDTHLEFTRRIFDKIRSHLNVLEGHYMVSGAVSLLCIHGHPIRICEGPLFRPPCSREEVCSAPRLQNLPSHL